MKKIPKETRDYINDVLNISPSKKFAEGYKDALQHNPNIKYFENGGIQSRDQLIKLDQLTNFTNYNTPTRGGWLEKYK